MEDTINKRIRRYRRALDYTQGFVAQCIGMQVNAYSQMERSGIITCEKLLKISEVLGVDACILLYGEKIDGSPVKPSEPPEIEEPIKKPKHISIEVDDRYEEDTLVALNSVSKKKRNEIYSFAISKLEKEPKNESKVYTVRNDVHIVKTIMAMKKLSQKAKMEILRFAVDKVYEKKKSRD